MSNFDAQMWTSKCRDVVKAGNRAKVMTYYSCGFQYDPQHGVVYIHGYFEVHIELRCFLTLVAS